jgi:hypothetical protein
MPTTGSDAGSQVAVLDATMDALKNTRAIATGRGTGGLANDLDQQRLFAQHTFTEFLVPDRAAMSRASRRARVVNCAVVFASLTIAIDDCIARVRWRRRG